MNKTASDQSRGVRPAGTGNSGKNLVSAAGPVKTVKAIAAQKQPPVSMRLEDHHNSEVHRVYFEYFNPAAQEVLVAGSFNDWNPRATPMTAHRGGKWSTELLLKPGHYEYRFVVDGHWLNDPAAETFVANPFNGLNCVLEVKSTASAGSSRG